MWIKRFSLKSYYSFDDSGWIELSPSFNVFVGANNSGKTSLLKAFSPNFTNAPHRNKNRNRPNELPASQLDFDVEITLTELFRRHMLAGSRPTFPEGNPEAAAEKVNLLLRDPKISLSLEVSRTTSQGYHPRNGSSLSDFRNQNNQRCFNIRESDEGWSVSSITADKDNLVQFFSFTEEASIFYLEPQRLHVGSVQFGDEKTLTPNASNLPNVLLHLQTARPAIFNKIVSHVSEISQSIKSISATPNGNNIEIIIWPTDDNSISENSFKLNESGTGIGQLISIITAAATNNQCVIVIDEISTFLHPSATKRLISILKSEYSHHQYIISTHSSEVINSIGADSVLMIKKEDYLSTVQKISAKDVSGIRLVASELGFSMMDVFSHERMIWVEGETELVAFPYLLRKFRNSVPEGIGFSTVSSASDFDASDRSIRSITEIYQHVAGSVAPLIKGLAFGLDREGNSDEAVQKAERSKRKLKFLPRRCVECYLLMPEAISSALSEADGTQISADDARTFLEANGDNAKYKARSFWNGNIANPAWLKKVDAAKLLADCFTSLSENRTEYRKTRDSIEILKFVSDKNPESLIDLVGYVELLIEVAQRDTKA